MKQNFLITVRALLAVTLILWSTPRAALAAVFTDQAEAAVIVKDAEASEAGLVGPGVQSNAVAFGAGTGLTGLGQNFWEMIQTTIQSFKQPQQPVTPVQPEIAVEEIKSEKSLAAGAATGVVVEEMAIQAPDVPVPVTPAVQIEAPITPEAEAVKEEEEDKVLFPILYESQVGAAAAGAAAVEGGLLATTGAKITAGILLLAIALGIILPLSLSDSGGSGNGDGGGNGFDPFGGGGSQDPNGGSNPNGGNGGTPPVPEPFSLALFGMGLVGLFLKRKTNI